MIGCYIHNPKTDESLQLLLLVVSLDFDGKVTFFHYIKFCDKIEHPFSLVLHGT